MIPAISFAAVCHRLGISDRNRNWQAGHVRFLIRSHDFPAPLPSRAWRCRSMQWDPRAVDHWFDDRAGRSAVQTAHEAETANAARLLDQRAAALACQG